VNVLQPGTIALTPGPSEAVLTGGQSSSTLADELLRTLPSHTDITILLARLHGRSPMYHHFDHKTCCFDETPEPHVTIPDLRRPESNPVLLAGQMFHFAAALRQIPRRDSVIGLSKHHHTIMDELAESAISNVTTNDGLLGTLDGLELMILEIFYHMDCGDARRAWVTSRRAVMTAQLLGLHRPDHHRFKVIDDSARLEPETMWTSVVCMERVSSLLLGLPTSTGDVVLTQGATESDLIVRLGNVAGRILERNRIEVSKQALDLTKDVDQELIRIAEHMPSAFWRPLDFARLSRGTQQATDEIRRALDHGRYYNLVIQLHLPHMLCPSQASQRLYSKIACVNASREILNRHIDLQSFEPAVSRCRMIDFPALIAGMALVLAHAISHCGTKSENLFAHQRSSDRAMVERTLENLEFVSELRQDTLLVKCVKLLTDLLAIEEDAAQGHRNDLDPPRMGSNARNHGRDMLISRAPFLGGIRLSNEGIAAAATSKAGEGSSLSESTSIGGIGAIHVNSSRTLDTDLDSSGSDVTGEQSNAVSQIPQAASYDLSLHDDQIPLEGAAGLDDWAFLGTDTAYFESLMRGIGEMPIDGALYDT